MNWNPMYSPVWRWLGANGVVLITGGAAYITKHPEVLQDPQAQTVALYTLATTALSWLLGAHLKKPA